jgi:hypothetical protein
VITVTFPEDGDVARVDVGPGDTVVLPFDSDAPLMMREGSGNLGIKVDRDQDHTVVLKGFADAMNDPQHPVVVESRDGTPIDVAMVLAMTDPNLDVQGCGWGPPPPDFDFGGGIYQPFEGGVVSRPIEAVGPLSAEGPALQI